MAATSISSFTDAQPPGLVTTAYPAGGATVIALTGSLHGAGFAALDRLVTEALDQGHRNLVLDLHELRGLDPQALGLLWAALRGVRRRGGTLAAARARPPLRPGLEALSSGGLALYDTVRAALSATHHPDADR
jgi:anti-anti-sigma factor